MSRPSARVRATQAQFASPTRDSTPLPNTQIPTPPVPGQEIFVTEDLFEDSCLQARRDRLDERLRSIDALG